MHFVIDSRSLRGVAIARELSRADVRFDVVENDNRRAFHGRACDALFYASGNHLRWRADEDPNYDFHATVNPLTYYLHEVGFETFVLLSSTAVYRPDAAREETSEGSPLDLAALGPLGFHKYLAEELVRRYAPDHLILRVPTLVGTDPDGEPTLEGVSADGPSRLWTESRLNVMNASRVAEHALQLLQSGERGTFNLAADDSISGARLVELLGAGIPLQSGEPRDAAPPLLSLDKVSQHLTLESSEAAFAPFTLREAG